MDVEIFIPVKFSWIPFSGFREEVPQCFSQSAGQGRLLTRLIARSARKIVHVTHTYKSTDILFPVKFCLISSSAVSESVASDLCHRQSEA